MKLLFLSNLYPPHVLGGYEILCAQVAEQLRARGHEVTVLTTGTCGDTVDDGREDIHRLLDLYVPFPHPAGLMMHRRFLTGRRNARVTREFLSHRRFDLAFVWSQLRLTLGPLRALQAARIPTALTLNDEHLAGYLPAKLDRGPRGLARFVLGKTIFSSATLNGIHLSSVTCISHRLKHDLLELGLPIDGARVIHQGIPIERFPSKSHPGTIGSPLRLLYVGQLHPYKGVHTLVDAAHRLVSLLQGAPVHVTIVGDGPAEYRSYLGELAARGPARVRLSGKVAHSELPAIYRNHHAFIFPSRWTEPFGLTHLEAMASGTPVVSTIDGGHAELMRDGENALVFEKEKSEQLAARLHELAVVPGMGERLARAARSDVESRFTMKRYVDDLESFLAEAAGAHP